MYSDYNLNVINSNDDYIQLQNDLSTYPGRVDKCLANAIQPFNRDPKGGKDAITWYSGDDI